MLHDVVKRRIGNMRYVYHDAQAVHFMHHLYAEFTEPVIRSVLVIGRVGYMVGFGMGKRDVTNASIIEVLQVLYVTFYGCAVFHAQG